MCPTPDGARDARANGSSARRAESLPAAVDRAIAQTDPELKKAKKIRETQRLKMDDILKELRKHPGR
jgi:hypothetical protein